MQFSVVENKSVVIKYLSKAFSLCEFSHIIPVSFSFSLLYVEAILTVDDFNSFMQPKVAQLLSSILPNSSRGFEQITQWTTFPRVTIITWTEHNSVFGHQNCFILSKELLIEAGNFSNFIFIWAEIIQNIFHSTAFYCSEKFSNQSS